MKPTLHLRSAILASAILMLALPAFSSAQAKDKISGCSFGGKELKGKVQVVESFPDIKVQVVDSFPSSCGKWQFVDSFPDFKIQYVTSFPDVKVQFVESFPGMAK